jgi:hypothetical protein
MRRASFGRLRDWWQRRRGKRSRVLDFLAGPDDDAGAGVREPRRPLAPTLSGAIALDEPRDEHVSD